MGLDGCRKTVRGTFDRPTGEGVVVKCSRNSVTYEDELLRGGGGGIDHVMNDDRYTRCGGVKESGQVRSVDTFSWAILSSHHSPQEEEGRTTEDIKSRSG